MIRYRTLLLGATAIFSMTGCYARTQVVRPAPSQDVRIDFHGSGRDLKVLTRHEGLLLVAQLDSLTGRVIQLRGDSAEIRIFETSPYRAALKDGTVMLPVPVPGPGEGARWVTSDFSARRTMALVLGAPLIVLGLLMILVVVDFGQ